MFEFSGVRYIMKDINFYLNLDYPYILEAAKDGGFDAQIPLLPGCIAHGETPEEALQYLNVAKCDWITSMLERHIPIPQPPYKVLSVSRNWRRTGR